MEILSLDEILKAICGRIISSNEAAQINGISTDSRSIRSGDLFFALKGERFDGHQFVMHAMNTGAAGAVISNEFKLEPEYKNFPVIRVKDTTTALGDLAKYYRKKLSAKIIGITGSNGKTTTKEMTYHLLSQFGFVAKSQKSFNNFIGVPVTIFEIENRHQYGVLEMGTNAPGEIRRLSEIGAPDIAVIVNISKAHLEGLKSIEGVARAKAEILENLRKNGVFVYNADNTWCAKIAESFKGEKLSFGFSSQAHIKCTDVKKKDKGYVLELNGHLNVPLPIPGYHNITNCLASFAICKALGHDIRCVKDAFSSFKLPLMRIEQQRIGKITVINDAYNANPESVRAAIQYLSEIDARGRKVFVCGDMLELGNESAQLHKEIGETVSCLNIDLLWTVGKYASEIAKAAKSSGVPESQVISFQDVSDITPAEINELRENDIVLIKGSRGMHMENIIEKFKEFFSKRVPAHNCN
ncbi:MAG: UDP-N-acetylmuramoyl-tripeptide--D-alanyl-D-alanine ligase [Planctomycetes bacterium]|nr:UDP-N-acetylmuramoyl-tripeptide--D-alanyl-D-alanine ligase [Planctomycetota bacterium]